MGLEQLDHFFPGRHGLHADRLAPCQPPEPVPGLGDGHFLQRQHRGQQPVGVGDAEVEYAPFREGADAVEGIFRGLVGAEDGDRSVHEPARGFGGVPHQLLHFPGEPLRQGGEAAGAGFLLQPRKEGGADAGVDPLPQPPEKVVVHPLDELDRPVRVEPLENLGRGPFVARLEQPQGLRDGGGGQRKGGFRGMEAGRTPR